HYIVDSANVVQTVHEQDIAFHARSDAADTVNRTSIGIEHAGSAAQNAAAWGDAYNEAMLARSARLVAGIARRWNIPIRWLTAAELRAPGARGITGHGDVTRAYRVPNGHGDPGASFPIAHYLALVDEARP
ncbi:MAG: N-acetylmuramoyl-L-alanine amidase, partial [Polyangiales bacterium]